MNGEVTEALLLPWWKIVIYIATIAIAIVSIRVTVKFDWNAWADRREENKQAAARLAAARSCKHGWTLYPSSPYSRCGICMAVIDTALLLTAMESSTQPKPLILAAQHGVMLKPGKSIVVTNYIGRRDSED